MNKYKKLLSNSAIFAIGNMGSKLVSFFLVPLYTYYLTTSQYGVIDLITNTTTILLPIFTLGVSNAVLRYAMASQMKKQDVFTNGLLVTIIGNSVFVLISPLIWKISLFEGVEWLFLTTVLLQSLQILLSQFTRAIGKIKAYAINGIIMTITNALFNIFFIVFLKLGIQGYLGAFIISNAFSILYLTLKTETHRMFRIKSISLDVTRKLTNYSIPLIPNSLMWWINDASSRYFILFFLGSGSNGIYAIASKIPLLLSVLVNIFDQAWQLSAIEEFENNGSTSFYNSIFQIYYFFMFASTSLILIALKFIFSVFVSPDFYGAWEYVPFLLIGVCFSSLSGFLGSNYIALKNTKGVLKTSLSGGVLNLVLSIFLVPIIGMQGAAIATMSSYFVMFVLRYFDTKKNLLIKIEKSFIITILLLLLQSIILFVKIEYVLEVALGTLIFLLILLLNRATFIKLIRSLFAFSANRNKKI